MAQFEEASPICRGKNLSWETVLLFFNNMPREAMPKAKFNSYVEARINAWTQTHSQIARQLAFYYEENGVCYPRFTEKTSLQDLFAYMQNWAAKYFIPNPYAPSLKGKVPTCIYSFFIKSIKDGQTDFDEILDSIFQVKLSSHDKVNVYLSYFTNLLIDNNHQVSINEKLGFLDSELYPAEEYATDTKKYYEYYTLPSNDIFDSDRQLVNKSIQQIFYGGPGTENIRSYLTALRTKPFMLLAGISGTGKSRIVRKLAQATTTQEYENEENRWKDNRPENFELIQVKPNWHNSMDVVGFYSNISGKYEFTPFVEFIVKAWQHKDTPYFLCLDEMNLAPVEEYFAEFLSAIESRSTDENDDYITDPIIKPFKNFGEKEGKSMLIQLLGDADPIDKNPVAIHFYEKGLTLPPNLMVMGTVNMDETTFSFSRKVLDRAMSVEMNEVDYDKFLSGESEQFPLLTDMNELLVNRPQRAAEVTEEIESDKVIAYLKDVNTLMEGTPFKLGYRAANEAMLYVAACKKFAGSDYALANALDEFTLMKILSRIEGDDSRLGIADDDPRIATLAIEANEQHTSLLTCLKAIVHKHIGANSETEKKINQMCNTLEREHFVSYWA